MSLIPELRTKLLLMSNYKDGETFTTYSDEPYDRHTYRLKLKNGKAMVFEDYEMARNMWWQLCGSGQCETIEVVDHIKSSSSGKGF